MMPQRRFQAPPSFSINALLGHYESHAQELGKPSRDDHRVSLMHCSPGFGESESKTEQEPRDVSRFHRQWQKTTLRSAAYTRPAQQYHWQQSLAIFELTSRCGAAWRRGCAALWTDIYSSLGPSTEQLRSDCLFKRKPSNIGTNAQIIWKCCCAP
jgi:hypothetical protein